MLVGFSDELWSGISVVAAPAVEREHALEHGTYTLAIFAIPQLVAAILETVIDLYSDRWPRRAVVSIGLATLAAALVGCALADTAWLLSAGLAVAGTASGVACAGAQAELIALYGSADKALTRWTTFASAGDLLVPIVVGAAFYFGWSYRTALAFGASTLALQAIVTWRSRAPAHPDARKPGRPGEDADDQEDEDPEEQTEPLRAVLSRAARNPRLWIWLGGVAFCSLLDELAAALAALRLRVDLGATEATASASLIAFSAGAVAGSLFCERFLDRFAWRALLITSTVLSIAATGLFLLAPSTTWTWPALVLLGASVAPHYPLAKARAYETLPERPGLVNAAATVFSVFDVVAPPAVGVVADRWGLTAAFGCLLLQPVGLLLLAIVLGRTPPRKDAEIEQKDGTP